MTLQPRIIPVLLLHKRGLYKTKQFKNPKYVGDPINAVRILNEKEVDELLILDIDCSLGQKEPNYELIEEIASEAFMPVGYGGGVANIEVAKRIFQLGIEKVIVNSALFTNLDLLGQIAGIFGVQAVVASIDYRKSSIFGAQSYYANGTRKLNLSPMELARIVEKAGAGEIILNAVDREGCYNGYDIELLKNVVGSVNIPVIVSGGASSNFDFDAAKKAGASGMAAGSVFIFQRPHNAVLISYPSNYFYNK